MLVERLPARHSLRHQTLAGELRTLVRRYFPLTPWVSLKRHPRKPERAISKAGKRDFQRAPVNLSESRRTSGRVIDRPLEKLASEKQATEWS